MVLPIIGAVIGGGLSMASSAAQTSAQNDAIRAQNEAKMSNYKTQLRIRDKRYKQDQNIYANKLGTYNLQLRENELAASKAYASQQQRMNDLYKSYAFGLFDEQIKMTSNAGKAAAAGKTGRSAARLNRASERVFLRSKAKGLATLKSGAIAQDVASRSIADQLRISNRNAWTSVAIAPLQPEPLEVPVQAPGVNSTVAGLSMLSSGISGAQQGYGFGTNLDTLFNG